MNESVLQELIRQMMAQTVNAVSFGWQGGEPTLMGREFFEKAVALQQRFGNNQQIGNGLQTNGLLIDDQWAHFLAEYQFLIGLSLDGPRQVHDYYRTTIGGKGTWQRVVDSAKRLLDAGCSVNALTVVNNYSVQFAEEIFEFHRELGLNFMQFIPCIETDPQQPEKVMEFSVTATDYGRFLCQLFDCWIGSFVNGVPTTSIRLFDAVFFSYVDMAPPMCSLLPECGNYVVVEHNGDVYSCDFFVEDRWRLGNILEDTIIDLLNSPLQQKFGKLKAQLPEQCCCCPWLKYCRGGCTKHRLGDQHSHRANYLCQAYKMFFEHSDKKFKQLAAEWHKKRQLEKKAIRRKIYQQIKSGDLKVSRNDPCPCGSGIKFKKCCEPFFNERNDNKIDAQ